jgi:hypothetical protein
VEMQSKAGVVAAASLITTREIKELVGLTSIYEFECFDKYGNLKWEERVKNLITNEGLNDVLNKYFKGSAYTAAWYVGLRLPVRRLRATRWRRTPAGPKSPATPGAGRP